MLIPFYPVFSPDDPQLNFQRLGRMSGIDDITFPPSSHFINLLMPSTAVSVTPTHPQQQQHLHPQHNAIFLPSSNNVATVVSPSSSHQSLPHTSLLDSKTYFEFSESNCFLPSQISNAGFASSDYHQVALVYKSQSVRMLFQSGQRLDFRICQRSMSMQVYTRGLL